MSAFKPLYARCIIFLRTLNYITYYLNFNQVKIMSIRFKYFRIVTLNT
jgi:hypothetical protein